MYVTPKMLRAARLLLGLTQDEIGEAAGLSGKTVARIEAGGAKASVEALAAVQNALERKGVVFLPQTEEHGEGLRMPRDARIRSDLNARQPDR
jgi:transcriptional regulator with XRE-family HTH domain